MAVVPFAGCKQHINTGKEISIRVDSFGEAGKQAIEKDLSGQDGVMAVKAHLRKKIVTITYDTTKINKDKLVAEIEKVGFRTEFTKAETVIKKP